MFFVYDSFTNTVFLIKFLVDENIFSKRKMFCAYFYVFNSNQRTAATGAVQLPSQPAHVPVDIQHHRGGHPVQIIASHAEEDFPTRG